MIDEKYFLRIWGSRPQGKFRDDNLFLLGLIRRLFERLDDIYQDLSLFISQPNSYSDMILYKGLKDREMLDSVLELSNKLLSILISLKEALIIKKESDIKQLIETYNNSIKSYLDLSEDISKIYSAMKEIIDSNKNKNNKDVYIG